MGGNVILRSQIGVLEEIYSQMPLEEARNYEAYRKLVYFRFGVDAEHLRQKFRSTSKNADESFAQLGARMKQFLNKWLEQEHVTSLDQMKNVFGLEEFYSILQGNFNI